MLKWSRSEIEDIRKLLNESIDDVDAEIINGLRRNNPEHFGSRENLLSQLDVLEKVRERLNVRYDRNNFDQPK